MHYRVLGPLEVQRDDAAVELGGPKQRAVLAAVLLDPRRVVPVDVLIDRVWGDDAPASAESGLQVYVSNLRRKLRDEATATSPIVRQMPGYRLEVNPEDLDLTRFLAGVEAARAAVAARDWTGAAMAAGTALALWRGPLLADLQDSEWVRVAAAGLDERRGECVEHLVTAHLGQGHVAQAVMLAGELHTQHGLRERACWLYMVALHRAGRTTEALEIYRRHVDQLNDELGLEPGPALRDLHGAILRQDAELLAWPGAAPRIRTTPGVVEPDTVPDGHDAIQSPLPSSAEGSSAQAGTPDASALVGRSRELREIQGLLDDVRAGRTDRWMVLTGPAGIGKSRLGQEAVARAASAGWTVVRAGCPDDEGVPPWWPVRQIVRALGGDEEAVLALAADVDVDGARFAAYGRVQRLLAGAAKDHPLLLLIDDVQWADLTSLRFLTHLAAVADPARTAVVLTVRDGVGSEELDRLLETVARREGTRQLAVPPLGVGQVRELMAKVSGDEVDPDEARALARRTGGNPFFVSEYARLPREERESGEAPLAVRAVLGRRLSALDPAVLQVLRSAAIIGETLDIQLLRAVTRLDPEDLADLLDEAADERIIVASPGARTYAFAHALLRDEVLAGMSQVRRQRLHARVADALGHGGPTERLVRRAAHLLAAVPLVEPALAYEACQAAAADAEQRWVSDTAAQWWEAALQVFDQLPPEAQSESARDEILIAQVGALARAGRGQTVLDVLDAALVDAMRDGRTRSAGRLASTLLRTTGAWPWAVYGEDPGPLLARLGGLETLLAADPVAHVQVLAAMAVGSCYDPDGSAPDRLSGRALELAEQIDDPGALADALLGRALAFSGVAGRARESLALLGRLAALPHEQERIDAVLCHGLLTMAHATLGDIDAAQEHCRLGITASDLLRLPVSRVQFRWAEGMLALWRGDLPTAEAIYHQASEMHQQTELYVSGVHQLAVFAARWAQGRLATLDPTPASLALFPWQQACVAAARGQVEEADRLIGAELQREAPVGWTTHGQLTMLAHSVADAGLAHHAPALLERLDSLRDFMATIGQVAVVGPIALAIARLHLLLGERLAAAELAEVAEQMCRRSGASGWLRRCSAVRQALAEL